ncbi:hypothetical protein DL95DRAFT_500173 [Leptodontidium sp. 2 PMI_412]|nr:hypothetical protein DL95DRAFT_500173 [Leptodontidium sp. 2 PMI_412]
MAISQNVTEVVEIPLSVPFAEFLHIFQLQLLPVLLAEPGVISVRTGTKIRASEDSTHAWAVSLTEWDSLESHAKFVQKSSSVAFFETTGSLSLGPPAIDHYKFGSLAMLGESECTRVIFEKGGLGQKSTGISAASLDHKGFFCGLSPVKVDFDGFPRGVERYFDVLWYSYERKALRSSL